MGRSQSDAEDLLTDEDLDISAFDCCDDVDVVLQRCPRCGHIWAECLSCHTWFINLDNLNARFSCFREFDEDPPLTCAACEKPFRLDATVEDFLPTAEQVVDKGYGRYLMPHLRAKYDVD